MLPARRRISLLLAFLLACFAQVSAVRAESSPIRLKIVGGLADVSQYVRYEEPFWRSRIAELTGGRVQAEIAPFDRSGIRGQEMLQLMRLGVVPFGTALLAIVATEEPEFNAVDLPALAPDMASLRQTVTAFRPHIEQVLRERYQIELLGIYTYPAQVVFCTRPFAGLADLAGRRIRSSSVGQSEMLQALGATPVVIPFAEVVQAIRGGVVECAITGTLSGNAIGLHEITTHVHAMALAWGISIFGANATAWAGVPTELQEVIRNGITDLEQQIWAAADRETGEGLACNAGLPTCTAGRRGSMTVVPVSEGDNERRRRLLTEVVLPRWVNRCGPDCVDAWNDYLAPTLGIRARPE
ncbi:TRAP transporter substrate-binding protein [Falsiroseomonas sp.]|uniref:TRAP transporter substrate-binding protein n=1 Tax=Falsiroseomonas sp. TaxID=2870721 RepID=UPI003F71F768